MVPKLSAHRIEHSKYASDLNTPRLFDLNKVKSGISIPDQMRRGFHATLDALDKKFIGEDRPLLVIGAGVAGLMAAMTAVGRGVTTWVIEQEAVLCTQATCQSRYVCPTQYAWPLAYWREGCYPITGEPMPFSWTRGLVADVVKNEVEKVVDKFLRNQPVLFNVLIAKFEGYDTQEHYGELWIVPRLSVPRPAAFPNVFSMALGCAGFGKEITTIERKSPTAAENLEIDSTRVRQVAYTGFRFWQTDKYEWRVPPLGISSGRIPKVLISGSGDGALQDFLRIVTRPSSIPLKSISAGEIYLNITRDLTESTRTQLEQDLLKAEEKLKRQARVPAIDEQGRRTNKCLDNADADLEHLRLINQLRSDRTRWSLLASSLDAITRDLSTELRIKLVFTCFHTSPFYALNRFLALLILQYADEKYPEVQILHPNTVITNVVSSSDASGQRHKCETAEECHDKDHEIYFATADCLDYDRPYITEEHKLSDGPYNVVIVRHGIDPPDDLLGGH